MTAPRRLGDIARSVLQQAIMNAERPTDARIRAGAASLIAFCLRAYSSDAESVIREAVRILDDQKHERATRPTEPPSPFWCECADRQIEATFTPTACSTCGGLRR